MAADKSSLKRGINIRHDRTRVKPYELHGELGYTSYDLESMLRHDASMAF
jgi:hypothetical protein